MVSRKGTFGAKGFGQKSEPEEPEWPLHAIISRGRATWSLARGDRGHLDGPCVRLSCSTFPNCLRLTLARCRTYRRKTGVGVSFLRPVLDLATRGPPGIGMSPSFGAWGVCVRYLGVRESASLECHRRPWATVLRVNSASAPGASPASRTPGPRTSKQNASWAHQRLAPSWGLQRGRHLR